MILQAPHWTKLSAEDLKRWPAESFTPEEFSCRGTGVLLADVDFLIWLQRVRWAYGKPMPLSRGYSTPEHNATIPGASPTSFHMKGQAADVVIGPKTDVRKLVSVIVAHRPDGFCLRLHGDRPYIHLDKGGRVWWTTKA